MPEMPSNLVNVDSPEYQSRIKTSLLDLAKDISKAAGNGTPVSQTQLSSYLDLLQNLIPFPKEIAKRTLSDEVREWVLSSEGIFESSDVVRELNLSSRSDKKNLSKIFERMAKESLITRTGEKRGKYRVIDPSMAPMNWESCDVTKTFDFKLPMGLHKLMFLYPKNIIVIAGDTNAGKTAYLLNAVRENADIHEIDYFTNDLTPEELKKRVQRFTEAGMNTDNFSKCRFIPRVKDFLDVLHPDRVTIIDYLQLTDKFWLVAEDLDKIYNKLRKSICIVAIQKKAGVKLGRGGDFAMERPRLYFTLERGKLIVKKIKNLVDPEKDPNDKYVKFDLWGGCKFIPKGGWQGGAKQGSREPGEDDDNYPF
jgi:hypothetical protein